MVPRNSRPTRKWCRCQSNSEVGQCGEEKANGKVEIVADAAISDSMSK